MTWHLVHDGTRAVSIGTVLADPLPDGLTAVTLTADQAAAVADGRVSWANGQVVVAPPADPEPDPIEARVAALETNVAKAEKVAAALVDKGLLTAKDITDAVVAEPVDEEAVVKP